MRLRSILLITVLATVIVTILLYQPVGLALFKIREPYFGYPIKTGSGKLVIRNDSMGEGDFGAKRNNGRFHAGVDILASIGAPVYASKSGVAFFGNVPTGYGKYVMIYHPDGSQTIYGHLYDWNGRVTRNVRKGVQVGFVGNTGNAANRRIQPHLHFEIRRDGVPEDPRPVMR